MILDSYSVERNFDEMSKELDKLKSHTLNQIKKHEEASTVGKILQLKTLWMKLIKIDKRSEYQFYSNREYIQIEVPEKCVEVLKGISLVSFEDASYGTKRYKLYIREDNEEAYQKVVNLLNNIAELDEITHAENITIKNHNMQVETSLFNLFDQIGLKKSHYGYKGRSQKQSEIYYAFSSEIRGQIPTNYSQNELLTLKENKLKELSNLWKKEVGKLKEERTKKEREQKEKEYNKKLALLLAKYDMELEDTWSELLDAIVSKNKYLRLAHYLEENRNDWNDGFDYAEGGLSTFTVESELDQEIENDITSHMYENWDGDGRVFRDCKYNYSVIYGIAADNDPQLYKDYEIVKEHVDSDY
jgi:hypothetical protein